MRHVISVVGARPQFVKSAAVERALTCLPDVEHLVIHTGQHFDPAMSEIFFSELNLSEPAVDLGVGSGLHGEQTGRMMMALERVLLEMPCDLLLLYGDTNSTLAGALVGAKLGLAIAHVEAGLRSFNRSMPEEINRVLTDHVSDVLFAPTPVARANLAAEGLADERVHVVGDVMYDTSIFYRAKAFSDSRILEDRELAEGSFALVTVHRAANTDDPEAMRGIVDGLIALSAEMPVVWPMHPRARKALVQHRLEVPCDESRLLVLEPVGYLDMIRLEAAARIIVTDSGGVQKEAFFHRVPCVTIRDETEWVELVRAGVNRLCGPRPKEITAAVRAMLDADIDWALSDYGDGKAAEAIARIIAARL